MPGLLIYSSSAKKDIIFTKLKVVILYVVLLIIALQLIVLPPSYIYAFQELASVPSDEKLEETYTDHFHIIFQERLRSAVPYLAKECEEAYRTLTPIFTWYPKDKIEVLFIDAFDTHNGWATAIPHNRICIYAAGAEPGSTIFQPGHYLSGTVYHELSHVLCMDMRYGYNRAFSNTFGKMLPISNDPLSALLFFFSTSPVALAPDWYLEGVAIWAETEFAPPGRGRGSLPDMIFRCSVQENNLLPYESWDLTIPYWPYGLGAYLYGMKTIQYIYENEMTTTEEPVGDLVQSLAKAFMFNFDSHSTKLTGKRFELLVHKMLQQEKQRQKENLEELKKLELTKAPRITKPGTIVYQPVFVGNNIYFSAQEEETRDSLYLYLAEENKIKKIADSRTTAAFGSLCPSPDGSFIYYTKLEIRNKDNYWYEVRRFNTENQEDTLVTNLGRYRALDISPDGQKLAAVSMRAGQSFLIETAKISDLAMAAGQEKILACGELQEDFSSPQYSPDGQSLAYVRADENGFDLMLLDRAKGTKHLVYHTQHQLLFPRWCPDGEGIIFSSDENGVYNLYEISTDGKGKPKPITHVSGGIFATDFSPDGQKIAAIAYDSQGYYLTLIPYQPDKLAEKSFPCLPARWKGKNQGKDTEAFGSRQSAGVETPRKKNENSSPYSSYKNMNFNYWSPWLTFSNYGVKGGIGAVWSDPVDYQYLGLIGGLESKYDTSIGALQYTYKGFYPAFHLYANQDQKIYPHLVKAIDGECYDYAEEVKVIGTALDIPFIKNDKTISWQIGYQWLDRNLIKDSADDYKGKDIETKEDLSEASEGAIWTRLGYFNGTAFKRSNSIEDGRFLALTTEKTDAQLGGKLCSLRILGEWNEYISNPWIKNHVLKLSGSYGFGEGDRTAQGLFGLGGFGYSPVSTSLGMPSVITLRGYGENFQVGDHIAKVSCAYRFPITEISKGVTGSMPVYYKQFFGEVFYEAGRVWDTEGEDTYYNWLDSLGIELNLSLKLLRFLHAAPGFGLVYAFDQSKGRCDNENDNNEDKEDQRLQIYVSIKGWVNF